MNMRSDYEFQNGVEVPPRVNGGNSAKRGWRDLEPLGNDLLPVPAFDPVALPEAFREHVIDIQERMQVPIDLPAVSSMAALSGAVNRRALIQPKRADPNWIVTPNIWGALITPPGWLKTNVISTFTRELSRIEVDWRRDYEMEMGAYAAWEREHKLKEQAWGEMYKVTYKGAKGKGQETNELPVYPEKKKTKPILRRLIANDPTIEALHQILSENPAGILLLRDELPGWLATLDRPGREGERQFFLESWNGDKPYVVDRVGRGSIFVENLCLSIFGGIQPGRLRQYLVDAIKDGPANDGLFQRFQLIVWPDFPKTWTLVDRPADQQAAERAAIVYETLAEFPADKPCQFRFADDSQELFYAWWSDLERKIRTGDLHPALVAHLSKYRSLMPPLALLFELADIESSDMKTISLSHARQAAAWCDYLEAHAHRIYGCLVSPELHAARILADKIKAGKLPNEFSTRDVYLKNWSSLSTPDEVRAALKVLEDCGWVRPATGKKQGGRPPERWESNPRIGGVRDERPE